MTAIRFFTVANEIVVWGTQGNIVWNLLELIMDGRNR